MRIKHRRKSWGQREKEEEGEFVAVYVHVHRVVRYINLLISKQLNWY